MHVDTPCVPIAIGEDDDADFLYHTGRWQEVRIPLPSGADMFISTLYGYSWAGHDTAMQGDNENLLAHAVLRQKSMLIYHIFQRVS